jgi:hypothetical protein
MIKSISLLLLALSLSLLSCGPSRSEIEAELRKAQFRTDSMNAEFQKERERKAALKQEYIQLKARLAGAQTKLNGINEFKLLRTQNEKAQQVTEQVLLIEEIKSRMEEIKDQLQ